MSPMLVEFYSVKDDFCVLLDTFFMKFPVFTPY
jgi:hypothetical protein